MPPTQSDRAALKSDRWEAWRQGETDQRRGLPPLPAVKPAPQGAALIDLPAPDGLATGQQGLGQMPLAQAIRQRRSRRRYTGQALTRDELSFLLWATQGARQVTPASARSLRTVPSAGARHPFETYLLVQRVQGLEAGLYRYLPLAHQLCLLRQDDALPEQAHEACLGQYVLDSAVLFIWTVLPYRTEWRYADLSPKLIALDAGHLCQNLYLASESIAAGTCALGAYDQLKMDALLGVDGEDEFAIYVAPVGKVR